MTLIDITIERESAGFALLLLLSIVIAMISLFNYLINWVRKKAFKWMPEIVVPLLTTALVYSMTTIQPESFQRELVLAMLAMASMPYLLKEIFRRQKKDLVH